MGIRCMVLFLSLVAALLPGVGVGNGTGVRADRSQDWRTIGGGLRGGMDNNPERGDVPGWVMITLMSAVLVAALLALAGPALEAMFNQAMDKVGS
ncbi:hypothetical protein [Arthrobacter sp. SLBN-100]|uniref:hypothetical protein n=1 Tax=Arthrobacter sp. SLBN-100 TaxID=2768450 RepID=UPI001F3FCC4C|nr:hypothetical protein [Arthrobacter sp. SLBN-100]